MAPCRLEGFQQQRQVVTAKIGHQCRQFRVAPPVDELRNSGLIAHVVAKALAPRGTALKGESGIELI